MKRYSDIMLAGLCGVLLAPVMVIVAIAVRVVLGSPVIFRQERAGANGRPFVLYKFRTMHDLRGPDGRLLPDAERLSGLGRGLRALSLDELPELWNVLRGDMSLVGPRPLPITYLARYTRLEAHRHDVRPGITGWAQVHGRNTVCWSERLALDVWYVEHRSLRLDLQILARTARIVARREGITADGSATMPELRPELAGM